jgi:phage baseplate assembly protein W
MERKPVGGNRSFLGTGWAFPPEFELRQGEMTMRTGEVFEYPAAHTRMVSEDEDIRQSLRILLDTNPGERIMLPAFGCGIRAHVFDTMTEGMIAEIQDLVERAILFFEPRITVETVSVTVRDALAGMLDINISYTIRTTNTRSNMVYPFCVLEATNARR